MQRILALDVGDRRIGLAVSDPVGITAQRLETLNRKGLAADLEAICRLVDTYAPQAVVVGLPLTLRGARGPQAEKVLSFTEALKKRLSIPVHLIDERLTTVEGNRTLTALGTSKHKKRLAIDGIAAQILLQQFLETHD
ncbi:MAG: Holliday junction resolvase RuvX [Candidatus Omnitrophica bacterium]|nr:Holliday junction resolvase RuvX [Candidatus Omnitrophota bacterium]